MELQTAHALLLATLCLAILGCDNGRRPDVTPGDGVGASEQQDLTPTPDSPDLASEHPPLHPIAVTTVPQTDVGSSHRLPKPAGSNQPSDVDADGVPDSTDNCPDAWNPDQWDTDSDGTGDRCQVQLGTPEAPFIIPGRNPGIPAYRTAGNTCDSDTSLLNSYPPNSRNESGPEVYYAFRTEVPLHITAYIAAPEPAGTDVDVHLLSMLDPLQLIARNNREVQADLGPGLYYVVLDTYNDGTSTLCGAYILTVELRTLAAGTPENPLVPSGSVDTPLPLPFQFQDTRSTASATSTLLHGYSLQGIPNLDGPEWIYAFTLDQNVRLSAALKFPEPASTNIDLVLLSSLAPLQPLTWGDRAIYAQLGPGTYYLVADTVMSGQPLTGEYSLLLSVRPSTQLDSAFFNDQVLAAVDYLYAIYGLQGYASAVLTHDMTYGSYGTIPATNPPKTMCVAAVMEVILQAMQLYREDTGDSSVFDFLPINSWMTLNPANIKAHIWVNSELDSAGTADALAHFGMGANVPFEELTPGSFLNLNRTTGTGHAVVFLAFIDEAGHEYGFHNYSTVGFKYFSSQGGYDVWAGGLDYRYAIFEDYGSLTMPYKRDIHIIYSSNQDWLNTGVMYHPSLWKAPPVGTKWAPRQGVFNPQNFDGRTE